MALTRTLG